MGDCPRVRTRLRAAAGPVRYAARTPDRVSPRRVVGAAVAAGRLNPPPGVPISCAARSQVIASGGKYNLPPGAARKASETRRAGAELLDLPDLDFVSI